MNVSVRPVVMSEDGALSQEDRVLLGELAGVAIEDRAAAFRRLLDRGLDAHYRLATVILSDTIESEDAVHDAALVAWHGFGQLRDLDRFDAWFARILINGCRDRLRVRRRRPVIVSIPVFGETHGVGRAADDVAKVGERDEMDRALATIDPDHAVTVILRYYLDLSVPEIAVRLAIPEGTVKSRLHTAMGRLRRVLDEPVEDQP